MTTLFFKKLLDFYNGSSSPFRAQASCSVRNNFSQKVGLLGRAISPSQGRNLNTGQHKHRTNAFTPNIHPLSGTGTHNTSVPGSVESSWLNLRGYSDRQKLLLRSPKKWKPDVQQQGRGPVPSPRHINKEFTWPRSHKGWEPLLSTMLEYTSLAESSKKDCMDQKGLFFQWWWR
jgi:hypothetical protein